MSDLNIQRSTYLTLSFLVALIVSILGAVSYAIYSVQQIDNQEIAPYVAVVNNNLGVKTKLLRLELHVKEFDADPSVRRAKAAKQSYRVMRASILNDLDSELTRELHAIHGDIERLESFIQQLKALKPLFDEIEQDQSNSSTIIRSVEKAYRYWNLYSREIVQRVQSQHSETLESWDEKHTNQLFLLVSIALASIIGVALVFVQYLTQVRLTQNLEKQTSKLEQAKLQAEESAKSKARFLANMSHEIRTPMNGVVGMLQVVKESELNAEQQHQVNVAMNSADALLVLINDILDFSKIESDKLSIEKIEFSLFDQVKATMETVSLTIPDDADLDLVLDEGNIANRLVVGDPTRIGQILTNLLANAVKFTSSGQIKISTELEDIAANTLRLRCSVEDTGIGIEQEKLAGLFDAFTQADNSTTRKYGGTGLGLSISKKLCELMGGSIHATSVPGEGSCFAFDIALGKGSEVLVPESVDDARTDDHVTVVNESFEGAHVLLVEDNPVNQMVAEHMLKQLGVSVDMCVNGREALEVLKENGQQYAVILMDCQMPEMDGYEATRRIREGEAGDEHIGIPIVAMTANAMRGDKEKCIGAGMDDYIAKPVQADTLKSVLQKQVADSSA